jgi:hypothetical protein
VSLFRPGEIYGQTVALTDLFLDEEFPATDTNQPFFKKTFRDIGTYEEYWQWVQGPLIEAIYANEYFTGESYEPESQFVVPKGVGGNRIVSSLRFRTARVRSNLPNACKLFTEIPGVTENWPTCYPPFSQRTKESRKWKNFTFETGMSAVRGVLGYGKRQ